MQDKHIKKDQLAACSIVFNSDITLRQVFIHLQRQITQQQRLTGACLDSPETATYYSATANHWGMSRITWNSNILLSNSNSLGHVQIHLEQQHTTQQQQLTGVCPDSPETATYSTTQQQKHTVTAPAPPETATYSATVTHWGMPRIT